MPPKKKRGSGQNQTTPKTGRAIKSKAGKLESSTTQIEESSTTIDDNSTTILDNNNSNDDSNVVDNSDNMIPTTDYSQLEVEIDNNEAETVHIAEQLENLNVCETVNDEEPVVEFVEYDVECITEEIVPTIENDKVIIEESNDIPIENDKIDANFNDLPIDNDQSSVIPLDNQIIEDKNIENDPNKPIVDETVATLDETKTNEIETTKNNRKKTPGPKPKRNSPTKKRPPPKSKQKKGTNQDSVEQVRRSNRIKSINVLKQRSKGHGLVKQAKLEMDNKENPSRSTPPPPPPPPPTSLLPVSQSQIPSPPSLITNNITPQFSSETEKSIDSTTNQSLQQSDIDNNKPVKVKSRWRRSSELEMNVLTPASIVMETCGDTDKIAEITNSLIERNEKFSLQKDEEVEARMKQFVYLKENLYLTDRMTCKEAKKMTCDCFLTTEEIDRGEYGCGEDCLNRLLMIECGNVCPVGDRCTNKKFQKSQFAPVEVFKTDKKGLGLRAAANIPYGEFILEYVGEVLDPDEFDARADDYSNDKNKHYYFMALRADAIIDATAKGNISRFINHSCEPNAETQKWTVNGELRIGFFSTRTILAGEEITFDYRFQRYGKEAQKCYCGAPTCRGWLGEEPEDDDEDEEEEEDEDDEEEEEDTVQKEEIEKKTDETINKQSNDVKIETVEKPVKKERKKRTPRKKKKARKEIFDDLDLDEEIEMLVTTGLKNQAHTLKLSRLMVRAKEPAQRTKLLRILRRGELPCRRLFLDYHGLRLIHGYMTDVQDLTKTDKKYESLRLELLQTLATLPIPNKTMLQDSKVLPTVELWSKGGDLPLDTDSLSPQQDEKDDVVQDDVKNKSKDDIKEEKSNNEESKCDDDGKIEEKISEQQVKEIEEAPVVKQEGPNYEEEIIALALKLLEEWSILKEVFKIPKKERIEQMKEHEREANRGYIAAGDDEKKTESRYRILKRYRSIEKIDNSTPRKTIKLEDRTIANFPQLGKHERRKMFALQMEQREEERRRKQREMWRQHEQQCLLIGTDPRLTAPFDPNRGYQCIWNPQINQWQNYPILHHHHHQQQQNTTPTTNYQYLQQPNTTTPMVPGTVVTPPTLPSLPYQEEAKKIEDCSQVKFLGPIPPPVKLPPKWKCAKDKYGRPYYYHIRIRKSQWEPPPLSKPQDPDESSDTTTSSSDTSSLSSSSSTDDSDSDDDDDDDDAKLLLDVRRQMEKQAKLSFAKSLQKDDSDSGDEKNETIEKSRNEDKFATVDARLKDIFSDDKPQQVTNNKKKRPGLVHEIIISPRSEEDRLQFRQDLKRYKQNKEKLRREKELLLQQQARKHAKEKRSKATVKAKMKEMKDANNEAAKRIKETFRSNMATVVVGVLNAYRKPDCKEGRITNTEDFKHLARKLTHFVMLKEMKHIEKIEDLVCTDNVKAKAREYIKKYMSKFGENYQKRNDEPDY